MGEVYIEDGIVVVASAEDVWRAIRAPARHAGWHPFVTAISGAGLKRSVESDAATDAA